MLSGVYKHRKGVFKHSKKTKLVLRQRTLNQFKNGMMQRTRNKISKKMKGRKKDSFSNKHKKNLSVSHKGIKHKNSSKKKTSDTMKYLFKIGVLNQTGENNNRYGKHHTQKTKEKIKQARIRQILPVKDTKIETKVQNFLKELRIEFFTHQYVNIEHSYQCDILIPSMNLVIECDGDYWHKYPVGTEIDRIRTSELIKKGFKVLRLWEREIKEMYLNGFKVKLKNLKGGKIRNDNI